MLAPILVTLLCAGPVAPEVQLRGYGMKVTLHPSWQATRPPLGPNGKEGQALLAFDGSRPVQNVMLVPGGKPGKPRLLEENGVRMIELGPGGPRALLGRGMTGLGDQCTLEPGPEDTRWFIAAEGYEVGWPAGYKLWSTGNKYPAFEMVRIGGDQDESIRVQGPFKKRPPPSALIAPGQSVAADEKDMLELRYTHEGAAWVQRHHFVSSGGSFFVVTAQAREPNAGAMREAAGMVAASLKGIP